MGSRRVWRARVSVVLGFGLVVVVSVAAMAAVHDWANPPNYDLAATRACLERQGVVKRIPEGGGLWTFPGLRVRFPRQTLDEEIWLYFVSSTDQAKAAEVPDSERMQRRRNVLTEQVASAPWDPRIARCLRERASG